MTSDEMRECPCGDPESCAEAVPGYRCKAGRTIWQSDPRDEQIAMLRKLLAVARCPDSECDGEGTTVVRVCCGNGVPDGHGGQDCCGCPEPAPAPCQWCDERREALAQHESKEASDG